jgi:hypothetical protein
MKSVLLILRITRRAAPYKEFAEGRGRDSSRLIGLH